MVTKERIKIGGGEFTRQRPYGIDDRIWIRVGRTLIDVTGFTEDEASRAIKALVDIYESVYPGVIKREHDEMLADTHEMPPFSPDPKPGELSPERYKARGVARLFAGKPW